MTEELQEPLQAPAPPAGPGAEVGEALAGARQALGCSVADVAQQLKFAPRQIEALERGDFARLPAGTFARGMVRAYARLLKLDPEPLVARIAANVEVPDNAAAVAAARRPIPITDSARRLNLIYAVLSLAILGGIGFVVLQWRGERARAARLTFVPAAQAPLEPQRAALASATTPEMGVASGPQAVAAAAAASTAAAPQAPPPGAPAAQPAQGEHRLALKFDRESWVEVRDGAGKVLLSQLNPPDSERVIDGKPPFALVIGNAQYVHLSYDGKPVDLAPRIKVEVARFTLE
ncbi:MAG TPA: RodZ domain-containing protein [Burkholderiales bacterium]|nr:RodZ domain-containing protein [Burkholderiales bacterium]